MLNVTNSLLVMIALFNAGLTVLVLRGNIKKPTNVFLAIYFAAICIWPLALIGTQIGPNYAFWFYSAKAAYAIGLIIAASFYLFTIAFPEEEMPSRKVILMTYGIVLAYDIFLFAVPSFLVERIVPQGAGNGAQLEPAAYITFAGIFCVLYISGLVRILRKYLRATGLVRTRLLIIGLAVTINAIGGLYFNIILASPLFNQFQYIWTGPLFDTITAALIVYAVFRLGFLNTKVIVTEFFIVLLWIFTFLRTIIATQRQEQILNGALFVFSIVIGSLLIQSVRREVEQRERIEKLATDLESANERLKQLDQLKSEFLSVASHQLRAPITAIRGYTANVLEGAYGELPVYLKEPLEVVQESSRVMVSSIEDYLNVSRIEQGRMKYEISPVDVTALARRATEEMKPVADKKGLSVSFTDSPAITVNADFGKIKQVFSNLIDNAIKYTEQGSVVVSVSSAKNAAGIDVMRFMTQDTGIGIPADEIGGLFEKFTRARDANKVNTTGTGLGLYVAKQLVEGQGGKIWAESDGPGKGSRFIVEVPLSGAVVPAPAA